MVDPASTPKRACSNPLLVMDFLENAFTSDPISNFFVMNESVSFAPFLPSVNFGDQPSLPPAYPFRFKLPLSLPSDIQRPSLFEFMEKINQTVEEIFATPVQSLQRHFKIVQRFDMCPYGELELQGRTPLYGFINRNTTIRIITEVPCCA